MRKFALTLKHAFFTHKLLIFAAGSILVVVLGYGAWSKNQWDTYQARYTSWQIEAKKNLDTALALPSDTDTKRQKKQKSLKMASEALIKNQDVCISNSFVAWQRFIKPLAEQEAQCYALRDKLVRLGQDTEKLDTYLADQQAFVKIMGSAPQGGGLSDGEWEAQIGAWQKVIDQLKQLKVRAEFSPVKNEASEGIEKIKNAWQGVWVAHTAQNKEQYAKAQTGLTEAYSLLARITEVDKVQFDKLIAVFASSYEEVF